MTQKGAGKNNINNFIYYIDRSMTRLSFGEQTVTKPEDISRKSSKYSNRKDLMLKLKANTLSYLVRINYWKRPHRCWSLEGKKEEAAEGRDGLRTVKNCLHQLNRHESYSMEQWRTEPTIITVKGYKQIGPNTTTEQQQQNNPCKFDLIPKSIEARKVFYHQKAH